MFVLARMHRARCNICGGPAWLSRVNDVEIEVEEVRAIPFFCRQIHMRLPYTKFETPRKALYGGSRALEGILNVKNMNWCNNNARKIVIESIPTENVVLCLYSPC